MPTYEYECKSCKYTFEAFQSMKDEPLEHCPQCGKSVRRLINGGSGIIFKGSGFYVTDKSKASSSGSVNSSRDSAGSSADASKSSQSPVPASSPENSGAEKKPRPDSQPAASKSAAPQTAKN